MYLCLDELIGVDGCFCEKAQAQMCKDFPNNSPRVNYALKQAKLNLLHQAFESATDLKHPGFVSFRKEQADWLEDYAAFRVLRDLHQERAWFDWDKPYQDPHSPQTAAVRKDFDSQLVYYQWVQWQCFEQLRKVRAYAQKQDVLLVGDIPFLVAADSADAWAHPEYFKLDFCAGAPPDMYASRGQRWGMPPYNWDQIEADGFWYLKRKLQYAENFFDLYRVDHVVGTFRVWSIPGHLPAEQQGLEGEFDPADESLWEKHGRKILSTMIEASRMLPVAEDLGTIPPACPKVLEEFGIPGTDVQRWTKNWRSDCSFSGPDGYRKTGLTCLSTHDTSNWVAWWEWEAGTVSEALFDRLCEEAGLNSGWLKENLFEADGHPYQRLRWKNAISTEKILRSILGQPEDKTWQILKIYRESFGEKDRLWQALGNNGEVPQKCNPQLLKQAFESLKQAHSVFRIDLVLDWFLKEGLYNNLFEEGSYECRINLPGTTGPENWSLRMPRALEEI